VTTAIKRGTAACLFIKKSLFVLSAESGPLFTRDGAYVAKLIRPGTIKHYLDIGLGILVAFFCRFSPLFRNFFRSNLDCYQTVL
jgi:hypothetical protein